MNNATDQPILPVRIVCERTGLTPDLLRAWERRYRAVAPARSEGRQRLYSEADVERLELLVRALKGGRQISRIAALPNGELRDLIEADLRKADRHRPIRSDTSIETALSDALIATERFDGVALERVLRKAAMHLAADDMLDQVIGPLLFTIGSLWHQGRLAPANEHLASTTIHRVLTWMSENSAPPAGAPVLLVGTPAHQIHELGAMLAATTASGHGWRVVYLGASLPAEELARAAVHARADAVALSLVYPTADPGVYEELRRLRAALPSRIALLIGGSGMPSYADVVREIGAEALPSLAALREWLRRRSATVQGLDRGGARRP